MLISHRQSSNSRGRRSLAGRFWRQQKSMIHRWREWHWASWTTTTGRGISWRGKSLNNSLGGCRRKETPSWRLSPRAAGKVGCSGQIRCKRTFHLWIRWGARPTLRVELYLCRKITSMSGNLQWLSVLWISINQLVSPLGWKQFVQGQVPLRRSEI